MTKKNITYSIVTCFLLISSTLIITSIANNLTSPHMLNRPPEDDRYDDGDGNDIFENATYIGEEENKNKWITDLKQWDEDYYSIWASRGDTLIINCRFKHSDADAKPNNLEGNIDLELYYYDADEDEYSQREFDFSFNDNEHIVYYVEEGWGNYPAKYIIRVYTHFQGPTIDYKGTVYDLKWNIRMCYDDRWEENNNYDDAEWIDSGIDDNNEVVRGIQLDSDYYKTQLSDGDDLILECLFEHDEGDIDIELRDENGQKLASSTSKTGGPGLEKEEITYQINSYGWYYFIVYNDNAGNEYKLSWWTEPRNPGPPGGPINNNPPDKDDYYDKDGRNNDNTDDAAYIGEEENRNKWITDLKQWDEDYYWIWASVGDTLIINCRFKHSDEEANDLEGDIELQLYYYDTDEDEYVPKGGSYSSDDNEHIVHYVTQKDKGKYIIKVSTYGDYGKTKYDLKWNIRLSYDDRWEQNNNDDDAEVINRGIDDNNEMVRGVQLDIDYYTFELETNEDLKITCTFEHDEGNIDIELRDGNDQKLASSSTSKSDYDGLEKEEITYKISQDDWYYIRVYNDNAGNEYKLTWTTE